MGLKMHIKFESGSLIRK